MKAHEPNNAEPDWRRKASYDYIRSLSRRGWAWEFLRRNPAFQQAWSRAIEPVKIEVVASGLSLVRLPGPPEALAPWGALFRRWAW